jgi:hypothetical protein
MSGHRPASQEIQEDAQTLRSERVRQALATFSITDVQNLIEEFEATLCSRPPHSLN